MTAGGERHRRGARAAAWGVAIAAAAVACAGCGGSQLKSRTRVVGRLIATARDDGAQTCAPVELAMAVSHHDFARQEIAEGDYFRAKDELHVAETNVRRAIRLSPKQRCNPEKPGDRDHDGILDNVDKCPDRPEDIDGFQDADGCPDPDNDNDGILDKVDKCPNKPEDMDGFQDADGCPDLDNDKDGLADKIDQCPNKPEDKDGFQDADGCPDPDNDKDGVPDTRDKCPDTPAHTPDGCPVYKHVVVTKKKIEINETIHFDFNKATIKPVSFPLLDEVAKALKDHEKIRVRVEGHTDSRGSAAYNMRLSQARAESVMDYLIRKGISADRMIAKGYGETRPIADNRTKAGRRQNRRVEFVILRR